MSDVETQKANPAAPTPEPLALNHVGMRVPDIARTIEWYTQTLGFTLLDGPHHYERAQAPALMRNVYGTGWSALSQAHLAPGWRPGVVPGPGLYHFCITARLIDEVADAIGDSGGRVNTAVDEPAAGTYRMTYCEDPFGNAVEINDRSYEQAHSNRG